MENTDTNSEQDKENQGGISLESSSTVNVKGDTPSPSSNKPPKQSLFNRFRHSANIYIIAFILLVLIAITVIVVAYDENQHSTSSTIKSQNLSSSQLAQLANSDETVGSNSTILNVQSNAVFAGQVLIKQGIQIAGNLVVGGITNLNELNVTGASQLGQTSISKDLSVSGDLSLQGTATISKDLQVNGDGTFNGSISAPQITTNSLELNGALNITHHITTTGSIPSKSSGSALGSGGSASINGTDTAGTANINTGSNPYAGCLINISFSSSYSSTPHVLVTPIGSAAGSLSYYVNRSTSGFSICVDNSPPAGASFSFDYFVID